MSIVCSNLATLS